MVLPSTAGQVAERLGAALEGPPGLAISGLEAIERAGPTQLTFIRSGAFANAWASCRAGSALVSNGIDVPGHDATRRALLRVPDADLALISLLELLAPGPGAAPGVHALACVEPGAEVSPGAHVGPFCFIASGARIEAGVMLHSRVTIGRGARIGAGTVVHSGCVIQERCAVGRDCILHPNIVIGADGFGYRATREGIRKVPHVGTVEIGDRVEIGASTCIDRAKFGATTVGDDTKIDNLVQVGHNARIGRSCLVCGNVGIAGSVVIEDGVVIGAGAGIADGVTIGAGAKIAGMAGVADAVPAGEAWLGYRAGPAKKAMANLIAHGELAETIRLVRKLEQRIEALEGHG